jgi:hypothetical protein
VGGRGRVGLREKWLYFSYTHQVSSKLDARTVPVTPQCVMVHDLRLELHKVFEFVTVEKPVASPLFQPFQHHRLKRFDLTHYVIGYTEHPFCLDLVESVEETTSDLSL